MDPEVYKLYQDLLNKRYDSIDDYLTSSPVDDYNAQSYYAPKKEIDHNITFGGEQISDFSDDIDYGL